MLSPLPDVLTRFLTSPLALLQPHGPPFSSVSGACRSLSPSTALSTIPTPSFQRLLKGQLTRQAFPGQLM